MNCILFGFVNFNLLAFFDTWVSSSLIDSHRSITTTVADMSSSARPEASVPKGDKEKKGFGKVLSRVRTVLKRGESSKRQSVIAPTTAPSTTKPTTSTTAPKTESEALKKRYVTAQL